MFGVMGKPVMQGSLHSADQRVVLYQKHDQRFFVLPQDADTRQAAAFQRALQTGRAQPKQLHPSFGLAPDLGPLEVHDLRYMPEADLLALMCRGADRVIDISEKAAVMCLDIAWKGYRAQEYKLPADGGDVRALTRAALAIEVAKAVHDYIKSNTHRVLLARDPGAFTVDWDILTKLRVLEIYNVYTNHWMVRLVMLEADVQARAAAN
ncbi:hypothetical protein FIBSPDRAFT_947825 [Athelia psychrophila]|uniref:Uncharacterized protein n=1 Tax=Athelia psychrophila TaxID=1759441 RepID=A0A166RGB9_9AGAM|nr:hypothetical protein FIBSPDRAFT_947825 [Fibularhizoctonia sp. CBS 109695]